MFIKMDKEKFETLVIKLPNLLNDGWKLPDEGRIHKDICSEKDYFICEYTGDEVDKALLYIYKKSIGNSDAFAVIISPTAKETSVLKGKKLKAVCTHFENMLTHRNVFLTIHFEREEDKDGERLIRCNECGNTLDLIDRSCPHCGCSSLKSIIIPDSVTEIGRAAFYGCSSLKNVVISNSVTQIEEFTFSKCSSLESIIIPNSVMKILSRSFSDCSSLKSIIIPDSVTKIGGNVFERCLSLKNIIIPNSVDWIGDSAFESCSTLESIVISNSVNGIRECTFRGCKTLKNVVLPTSLFHIDDWAFDGCSSLESIVIPNSVTSISEWAFDSCSSLTRVTAPAKFRNKFSSVEFMSSLDKTSPSNDVGKEHDGWDDLNPHGLEGNDYEAWMDSFD